MKAPMEGRDLLLSKTAQLRSQNKAGHYELLVLLLVPLLCDWLFLGESLNFPACLK